MFRSFVRASSIVVMLCVVTACQSKESGAREYFAKSKTCPEDRVEVRPRPDVTRSSLKTKREAPPDIKSDPARKKLWDDKEAETSKSYDSMCEMWEARGCGSQTLLCCYRPSKHANRISCTSEDYGNGVSRW